MEFPLVQMELARAARRRFTFYSRLIAPGLAALGLGAMWLLFSLAGADTGDTAITVSEFLAWLSMAGQWAVVFLIAPLVSAPLIASERQERSFDLLLLAQRGWADAYLSKLASAFFRCEILLLSLLPLASIVSILGRSSLETIAAQFAIMSTATLLMCAMGLFVSSLCQRVADAYLWTIAMVGSWSVLQWMPIGNFAWWPLHAGMAMSGVFAPIADLTYFLPAMAECLGLTLVFAIAALVVLGRLRTPSPSRSRRAAAVARAFAPRDPIARLYAAPLQGFGGRWLQFPHVLAPLLLFSLLSVWQSWVSAVLPIFVVYFVTSSMWSARQNGWLELLMLTNIEDGSLARAMFQVQVRRAMWIVPLPLFASGAANMVQMLAQPVIPSAFSGNPLWHVIVVCIYALLIVASSVASTVEAAAAGCWACTLSGKPTAQTARAIATMWLMHAAVLVTFGCVISVFANVLMSFVGASPGYIALVMSLVTSLISTAMSVFLALYWFGRFRNAVGHYWRFGLFAIPTGPQRT